MNYSLDNNKKERLYNLNVIVIALKTRKLVTMPCLLRRFLSYSDKSIFLQFNFWQRQFLYLFIFNKEGGL